ncbi:drug/metabolite transporter (DMT)-like permease [Caballeronia udeis]|uniref:Drug/metabolite transporter (DMT)-like permease n=1 Tax=Caballeronia udeis TaxID=1232866 RepID=A0ABW8MDR8_9BURK
MSIGVVVLVLFAALLHASWNALVKSSPDKFLDIVLVTSGSAVFCVVALPFIALPMPASWPYVAASVVIHIVYLVLIGAAYRSGDMSHAYPLMRGLPPLLVALLSGPLIGEQLSAGEWGGILLICGGILGLLLVEGRSGGMSRASTGFALVNAVAIAGYTLVDGTGVRLSAYPVAYTMWIFLLTAPPILAWALLRRRAGVVVHVRARWHLALIGGACTLGAYILVLWAMTQAPIAMVAALRETAIVFATGLSVIVLKERFGWGRPAAAAVILLGVIAIKLA